MTNPLDSNNPNFRGLNGGNLPGDGHGIVRGQAHGRVHGPADRNFRGQFHRNIPGGGKLTTQEVTDAVSATLHAFPAKEIVDATGGSIRAAENVRQGMNAMSLTHFINACRQIPELRAVAMQMMGCDAETDPEFIRGLHHLINAHVRMGGNV